MKRSNSQDLDIERSGKKNNTQVDNFQNHKDWQGALQDIATSLYQNEIMNPTAINNLLKFLEEAPIENLDFNAIVQDGSYKSSTILHILVMLSADNYFCLLGPILARKPKLLNFTVRPQEGIHAGISALEIIAENVCKNYEKNTEYNCAGHYTLLKDLIREEQIETEALNTKFGRGIYEGKTVLFAIASILRKNTELMHTILQYCDLGLLNFNDKVESGPDSGKTTLWLLAEHNFKLEHLVASSVVCAALDFNAKTEQNKTVLSLIVDHIERNASVIMQICNHVPLHRLDFNNCSESDRTVFEKILFATFNTIQMEDLRISDELFGVLTKLLIEIPERLNLNRRIHKDMTPFYYLAHGSNLRNDPTLLNALLEKVPVSGLDFNVASADFNGKTPLWYIADLAFHHPAPLTKILHEINVDSVDLNVTPSNNASEKSILWLIAIAAEKHNPELLLNLINKFPVEKLDFTNRTNILQFSDISLREWLLNTTLAPVVYRLDVLMSIAQARNLMTLINKDYANDQLADPIKIAELENHLIALEDNVQIAVNYQQPITQYWAATFYQEMGLVDHLKKLAKSISKNHMFYDEIFTMLSETVIYGPQTYGESSDPNFNKRQHKQKLLEAFDYALEIQGESSALRKNIAFNFVYGLGKKLKGLSYQSPYQSKEPLLDNLAGGKETCLFAIKTLRKKVKLKEKLDERDEEIKRLKAELAVLKSKQGV